MGKGKEGESAYLFIGGTLIEGGRLFVGGLREERLFERERLVEGDIYSRKEGLFEGALIR